VCLAQSEKHKNRFSALGMDPGKTIVSGNMKYDLEEETRDNPDSLDGVFKRLKTPAESFLLLAASTHAGEEEKILSVYLKIKGRYPSLKLIIAPRHIERVSSIEKMIRKRQLSSIKLSSLVSNEDDNLNEIIIADTWGVLIRLYRFADLVFVGGSLVPHGGHNPAEVAYASKTILYGPHMRNFQDMIDEFRAGNAAVQVKNEEELEENIINLLKNEQLRIDLGKKAKEVVLQNQGATDRNISEIMKFL
jgi:3-deoxy-D-manno-octulosonic-acid transferase